MRALALCASVCIALAAHAGELRVVEERLQLFADDRAAAVVNDLRYAATDADGKTLQSTGATLAGTRLTLSLSGPAAEGVSLTADVRLVPSGAVLDWTLTTNTARKWQSGGFQFGFADPVTDARTHPIVRWVAPTGADNWEVAGDTPYPTTEWQWREVDFGPTALVMLSSEYDPDWIYGHKLERAPHWAWAPPAEAGERRLRMGLFPVPWGSLETPLVAEASGRPFALSLRTSEPGNLFSPGQTADVAYSVFNATDEPQSGSVSLDAHGYDGQQLAHLTRAVTLAPQAGEVRSFPVKLPGRGIVFVAAKLTWPGGETVERTTLGFLPKRPVTPAPPNSPFALGGLIANPEAYPDQYDLPTVLDLAQRIGVRWVRGGWVPVKADLSDADVAEAHRRAALLRERGILPYPQAGATVPKPEELPAFRERLKASLQRCGDISPYLEVGNELNFGTKASDYVAGLLQPVHDTMRATVPQTKILSMGLGGVGQDWLGEFVKAGGMDLIDVLSIHPGSHPKSPEFWEGWRGWVFRSQVQDALKAARAAGKDVWITEVYAPTPPDRSQVDLRTSADYLVRTYVSSLALGVKLVAWYQFQDGVWFAQRPKPDDHEYNFGIVYTDLTPKPAYLAYGAMTEQLEGATVQGRLDLGAPDLYGVRFLKAGKPLDVLWSTREKHECDIPWWPPEKYANDSRKPGEPWQERWHAPVNVTLPASAGATVTDLMGNSRAADVQGGKLTLALTGTPVYVRGLGEVPMMKAFWDDIP